jgi:hypothetical protein
MHDDVTELDNDAPSIASDGSICTIRTDRIDTDCRKSFSAESIASTFLLPPSPLQGRPKRISAETNRPDLTDNRGHLRVTTVETISMNRTIDST